MYPNWQQMQTGFPVAQGAVGGAMNPNYQQNMQMWYQQQQQQWQVPGAPGEVHAVNPPLPTEGAKPPLPENPAPPPGEEKPPLPPEPPPEEPKA